MTYIYDLLINLNDVDYSFYEWEDKDEIEYLKKGVLIKVSDYMYKKLVTNNIVIDNNFLNLLKDKTSIMKNKKIETITYMGIFTNGKDVIGLSFSKDGNILEKTRFLIQDELEILETAYQLKTVKVTYKNITDNKVINNFKTRKDNNIIKQILSILKSIEADKEKINYLYYEWFNKKSNGDNAYELLVNDIKNNYSESKQDFLKLLDIMYIKNNV